MTRRGIGSFGDLRRRRIMTAAALAAALALLLAGSSLARAAESGPSSQCVACHTDAAKLKALTPPDPPSTAEEEC